MSQSKSLAKKRYKEANPDRYREERRRYRARKMARDRGEIPPAYIFVGPPKPKKQVKRVRDRVAYRAAYYEKNRAELLTKSKAKRAALPKVVRRTEEQKAATKRREMDANNRRKREKTAALVAARALWEKNNPEEVAKRIADKALAAIEYNRIKSHIRRGRVRGAVGSPSKDLRARLFKAQQGKCVYCKDKMTVTNLDHILPLALGGSCHDENYQLLCPTCNTRKAAKHPIDFAREVGLLL